MYTLKNDLVAIGLMSGSSMDGIDGAVIKTNATSYSHRIAEFSMQFTPNFHILLRIMEYSVQQERGNLNLARKNFTAHLNRYIGANNFKCHAIVCALQDELCANEITLDAIINKFTMYNNDLVQTLLERSGLGASDVDVIGFHGQNLYHNPKQEVTLQIGDGRMLSYLSNIVVVNNFRQNDVKNGGQGAPFAPLYHQLLISNFLQKKQQKRLELPVAILNCGGISNITIIYGDSEHEIIGFDTGPGNILIDRYIREKTSNQEFMDKDGEYGAKGVVNNHILNLLFTKSISYDGVCYLSKTPPKALDTVNFSLIPELDDLSFEDACATLEAFTAKTMVCSIDVVREKHPALAPVTWVLSGGGWKNKTITKFFTGYLYEKLGDNVCIYYAEEIGCSGAYMEAEMFAYLAARSIKKLPISFPNTTNVSRAMCGGDVHDIFLRLAN